MRTSRGILAVLLLCLAARSVDGAALATTNLTQAQINQIKGNLDKTAYDYTWVSGTYAEALIELDNPSRSVFAGASGIPSAYNLPDPPKSAIAVASKWAAQRPAGAQQLAVVNGGAAGDPPSLGVAWMWMAMQSGATGKVYGPQLEQQVTYLLKTVPRLADGTISHRPPGEPVQIWSDFTAMVPPFLAMYGVVNKNSSVMMQAYKQIGLYRNQLRDPSTGLWKHVVLGNWQSTKQWSTGNAWSAWGMARTIATYKQYKNPSALVSPIANMATWTLEIIDNSFKLLLSSNLLPNNYYGTGRFADAASSALIAATAYRMASMGYTSDSRLATAEKIRVAVFKGIGSDGWLVPAVDPISWDKTTPQSPESLAFVLLLFSSWRDWLATQ